VLLAGCHPQVVIPEQPTAQEQYDFACQLFKEYSGLLMKRGQRREYADRAEAAFQMVIDRFPQEKQLVGRSELFIGMIWKQRGKERKALGIMEDLLEKHPSDDDIQIRALYEIGLLLDDLGKHRQAKDYYDKVVKRFGQSQKPEYRAIVTECRSRYQRVWSGGR
jgi:tetratricopeptide (TPR) repeat protein